MELRQLEHFMAVVEEQSFTRAARRANIVQSGLSSSIRSLERELSASLFVRGRKRAVLTPAGRALLPVARRILGAVRGAHELVAQTEGLLRGTISIGSTVAVPSSVDLPGVVARFRKCHPGVHLRIRQDSAAVLYEDLRSGVLDVALTLRPGRTPNGMTTVPIARSTMMLACAPGHRLASMKEVSMAELAREAFVDFHGDSAIRRMVERMCQGAGVVRDTIVAVNDVPLLLRLVERGVGVAIVPCAVSQCSGNVRYVPFSPVQRWQLVAAFVGDRPASAGVHALLELLPRLDDAAD